MKIGQLLESANQKTLTRQQLRQRLVRCTRLLDVARSTCNRLLSGHLGDYKTEDPNKYSILAQDVAKLPNADQYWIFPNYNRMGLTDDQDWDTNRNWMVKIKKSEYPQITAHDVDLLIDAIDQCCRLDEACSQLSTSIYHKSVHDSRRESVAAVKRVSTAIPTNKYIPTPSTITPPRPNPYVVGKNSYSGNPIKAPWTSQLAKHWTILLLAAIAALGDEVTTFHYGQVAGKDEYYLRTAAGFSVAFTGMHSDSIMFVDGGNYDRILKYISIRDLDGAIEFLEYTYKIFNLVSR